MLDSFAPSFIRVIVNIWQNIRTILLYAFIDQLSKTFLIHYLNELSYKTKKISQNFDLVYVWNRGVSFGIFGNHTLSNISFFALNFIITFFLILIRLSTKNKLQNVAYNLIIGGSIGNLIDRAIRGGVFDFIYLHYAEYNFPIFNIADAFISIGVAFLIYEHILSIYKNKN